MTVTNGRQLSAGDQIWVEIDPEYDKPNAEHYKTAGPHGPGTLSHFWHQGENAPQAELGDVQRFDVRDGVRFRVKTPKGLWEGQLEESGDPGEHYGKVTEKLA